MGPTGVQNAGQSDITAIRSYRAADRNACIKVFYRAVREGTKAFYDQAQRTAWAPTDTPDPDKPDKLLDQWCWVAEAGGTITGFMSLDRQGYLDMAFVLPEVMGNGTAGALYDALLQRARSERFPRLTAHASHLARRFFEKRAWKVDCKEEFAASGQVYERFHMSLDQGAADDASL